MAGAAALIKEANPSYSRTELWDALIAATVDVDASGPDDNTGHGKLVLPIMQVPASPRITSISAGQVRYNQIVTVRGINFGSSRGNSSVRIGAAVVTSFTEWSNTTIRFRVPTNARSGDLTVRTSEGTSNAVPLEITNPYLERVSPSRVKPGERLTLTGANFRAARAAATSCSRPMSGHPRAITSPGVTAGSSSRYPPELGAGA